MKFSRLSTIQFTENDFQSKSHLDMPIVPRGEVLTFMELEEGVNTLLFLVFHPGPLAHWLSEATEMMRDDHGFLSNHR